MHTFHVSRIFFLGCLAFAAGILVASFITFPERVLLGMLIAGIVGVVLATVFVVDGRWLIISLSLAAVALGIIRASDLQHHWLRERAEFMTFVFRRPESVSGIISGREGGPHMTRYTLENVQGTRATWSLLYTGNKTFHSGDRVTVRGMHFDTAPEAEPFLKREHSAGTLLFPKSIGIIHSVCTRLWQGADCIRYELNEMLARTAESFEASMHRVLPEPASSLAIGILTGSRSSLSQDIKDDFKRTGLSHIVAVSGYNISVIVLAVSTLLGYVALSRTVSFWISVVLLILFTVLTGATASVVRAAFMGVLVIVAQKESRLYSARTAIAFAGAAMLFQNPFLLRYDVGFLLSFLATGGLLILFPLLEERTHTWPKLMGLKDIILQSLSAQLFVLPVLIIALGSISLIFLLANAAVLIVIPPTMLFAFLGGVVGLVGTALGRVVAFPAYALLRYELGSTYLLARVPHASVAIESGILRWTFGLGASFFTVWLIWRLRRMEAGRHSYRSASSISCRVITTSRF